MFDGPQPIADVHTASPGSRVHVAGRIIVSRNAASPGAGQRLQIQDASGVLTIDVTETPSLGAWVEVTGRWTGAELQVEQLNVAHVVTGNFPHPDGEWLWANQRRPGQLARLQERHRVLRAIRAFFDGHGYVEVETPLMVPSPGLDLHLEALEVTGAEAARWLITSPEYQMKRLLAGGLTRIYQICKCFRRNEEGRLHQPEFTMLEWYRGFGGVDDVMLETETLVSLLAQTLHGAPRIQWQGQTIDVTPPWPRVTVAEAFARYAGVDLAELPDEDTFYRVLVERVEPALGRDQPTFLTEYPASMASLARRSPRNPAVAERFEAYVGGIELCNGFGELTDAVEQRRRLLQDQALRRHLERPVYPLDERFLAALEEGMPPSGGNALGLDRLVMLLLDAPQIQDVIAIDARRL